MAMISRGAFRLDIGSLVLDGFEPAGRTGCAQAFTDEFERLVRQRGFPTLSPHADSAWRLPPLSISAAASDPPSRVGRALARSLFEALHRAASEP
jgi:hypothetical protein